MAPWTGSQQVSYFENGELRLTNLLVSCTGAEPMVYAHDGFGRRVKKTAGYVTTYFFYDRAGQLPAEVTPRSGDTDIVRRYVFVEGELMGLVDRWDAEAGTPAWAPGLWLEIPENLRPPPSPLSRDALLSG